MGDDTHVTDVGGLVHEGPDLICNLPSQVNLQVAILRGHVLAYGEVTGYACMSVNVLAGVEHNGVGEVLTP